MYLGQKWRHQQARLLWQQNHTSSQPLPEQPIVYKPEAAFLDEWQLEDHFTAPQHYDHLTDAPFNLQQMNWYERTGITPPEARRARDSLYYNHYGLQDSEPFNYQPSSEIMTHARFEPQVMHTKHRASTPHFQLRNHFAVQDHLRYMYSSGSQVWSEYNWSSDRLKIMDFSDVTNQNTFINPVNISTLALSTDHPRSICMVGGLNGEFAYKSLLGDNDVLKAREPTTGYITTHISSVINHIDIDHYSNRQNYHAIISCNDTKIRTLDLETGLFLNNPGKPQAKDGTTTGHTYPFAINSTATCPDGRLRVAVGDSSFSLVINAQTGETEIELQGHSDYIFACAWSPDARYIATAGQDRLVNIYDTRTWRILSTFSSHVSSHRCMKFSPVGGGTRCLLLAEEMDRVTVVNAHTFADAQTHGFYGSVVGVDFERDGKAFWVANEDEKFGGFMRYERTGTGQKHGLGFQQQKAFERMGNRYEEEGPDQWILEEYRATDPRCVIPWRHGEKDEGCTT